jgi:hypothetical protein
LRFMGRHFEGEDRTEASRAASVPCQGFQSSQIF